MAPLPPSEMSLRCSWRGVSEGCMVLRCVLRAMEAVPMEDPMDIEDIAEEPAVPVAARGVPPVLSLRCNALAEVWEVAPVLANRAVGVSERPACSGCVQLELCAGLDVLRLRNCPSRRLRLEVGRVTPVAPVALDRYAAGVVAPWVAGMWEW